MAATKVTPMTGASEPGPACRLCNSTTSAATAAPATMPRSINPTDVPTRPSQPNATATWMINTAAAAGGRPTNKAPVNSPAIAAAPNAVRSTPGAVTGGAGMACAARKPEGTGDPGGTAG